MSLPTFLSTSTGSGTLADPFRSALEDAYLASAPSGTALGYPEGQKAAGRFAVQFVAGSPPAALLADPKFPQLPGGYPYTFADYLAALRQAATLKAQQKFLTALSPGVLAKLSAAQVIADLDAIDPTRIPRTLLAIYTDLKALTAAQQSAVWTDISSGSPAKYFSDQGYEPGAVSLYDYIIHQSGLPAAAITDAQFRLVTIYVRDNPLYLVNPAFSPAINVPGDQAG